MKPSKRIALRCDLSDKTITVGEQIMLTVGVGLFPGTIFHVYKHKNVKRRVDLEASGCAVFNLVIGEDRVALGTLFVS